MGNAHWLLFGVRSQVVRGARQGQLGGAAIYKQGRAVETFFASGAGAGPESWAPARAIFLKLPILFIDLWLKKACVLLGRLRGEGRGQRLRQRLGLPKGGGEAGYVSW